MDIEELDEDKTHIKVYISGPITNNKEHYEKNFAEAKTLIRKKQIGGFRICRPVSPLDYEVDYDDKDKWTKETWLKCIIKDLELLRHCDAIAVMPGWETSAGCLIEVAAAKKLGLYIFSTLREASKSADESYVFPTYKARETWKKLIELKNCTQNGKACSLLEEKAKGIVNSLAKPDDRSCYWLIEAGGLFLRKEESEHYSWQSNRDEATKFTDYKDTIDTFYKVKDKLPKEDVSIERHPSSKAKHFIVAWFDSKGTEKYVKALRDCDLAGTFDIADAQLFTKTEAMRCIEKTIREQVRDSSDNDSYVEPVICSYTDGLVYVVAVKLGDKVKYIRDVCINSRGHLAIYTKCDDIEAADKLNIELAEDIRQQLQSKLPDAKVEVKCLEC